MGFSLWENATQLSKDLDTSPSPLCWIHDGTKSKVQGDLPDMWCGVCVCPFFFPCKKKEVNWEVNWGQVDLELWLDETILIEDDQFLPDTSLSMAAHLFSLS